MTTDDVFSIDVTSAAGGHETVAPFRGPVLLVVNVASQCGFTPQYAGLEALYRRHRDRGFVVLGFPCNQFGRQEPGSDTEIQDFCKDRYDVTFPVFSKIDVNGPTAHPLFVYLKSQKAGVLGSGSIKWNFTKFLIDRSGRVVSRFGSATTPEAIEPHVVKLLG